MHTVKLSLLHQYITWDFFLAQWGILTEWFSDGAMTQWELNVGFKKGKGRALAIAPLSN